MRARLRVQVFTTAKSFSFNQFHNKEFCVFSQESYFIQAIEFFSRCLHQAINRVCTTVSNTENVFYCLNSFGRQMLDTVHARFNIIPFNSVDIIRKLHK